MKLRVDPEQWGAVIVMRWKFRDPCQACKQGHTQNKTSG